MRQLDHHQKDARFQSTEQKKEVADLVKCLIPLFVSIEVRFHLVWFDGHQQQFCRGEIQYLQLHQWQGPTLTILRLLRRAAKQPAALQFSHEDQDNLKT